MLELSPLLTAAKASACSMPASISVSRSKPTPVTVLAGEVVAEPAERARVLVDDRDAVLAAHQLQGERRADAAAAHDDDVHERTISATRAGGPRATLHTLCAHATRPCDAPRRVRILPLVALLTASAQAADHRQPDVVASRPGTRCCAKRLALPIFASDALSSVAYATQEILLVLTVGGTAFLYLAPWVALARRRADGGGGRVLPAAGAGLPDRRRRLRGRDARTSASRPAWSSPARCSSTT